LAFEELLIAEGSDWNWWYGPEHHSANDREFDELYRKHLSNVYQALGATPPDYLAQPIIGGTVRPSFIPQTAYIHPRVAGDMVRYFEWMGAAQYTSDRRSGSMHGKQFLLDSVYAGIDGANVYGRLDFSGGIPDTDFDVIVNLESWPNEGTRARRVLRLDVEVKNRNLCGWSVSAADDEKPILTSDQSSSEARIALKKNFEFKIPLSQLMASPPSPGSSAKSVANPVATKLRLRFSLWQNGLPVDALPVEGWIELNLLSEDELAALA
jgi:hypothetical protein